MKRIAFLFYLAAAVVLCGSCGGAATKQTAVTPAYNPFVDAFTSGTVSRTLPVYLVFSEDVAEAKTETAYLNKYLKIKPAVEGEFSFENGKTVVFRPAGEFERNTTYTVTADLSGFFDVGRENKDFAFSFATLPLALRANLEAITVNAEDTDTYDVRVAVNTPDREPAELIESLVAYSETVDARWTHAADGRSHTIEICGVRAGEGGPRTLELTVGRNKYGVKKADLLSVAIPEKGEFGVYDITYVGSPEKYVAVTFTENIDPAQLLRGLAFIEGNDNETVVAEGNVLKLFPDSRTSGQVSVHLSEGIRSASGRTLSEDVELTVEIGSEVPAVRFVGEGVIIPESENLMVPFQAVYLRGVQVRVIRVMEDNIGTFLQTNPLDGSSELMRVGRLVAFKTIWLDEQQEDLSSWHTYGLDLRKIIEPEPGAIYRIVLTFNRDLSAYPCEGLVQRSKEQISAEDALRFANELEEYDDSGNYYYDSDYMYADWSDYTYSERNDPCSNSFYRNTAVSRNVLATNLGVIAKGGEGNSLLVMVHNIVTTAPEKDATITVYNFQNQKIGHGMTGPDGQVRIECSGGRPYYLRAAHGTQKSYLRLDGGSALSTSSFDVSGEVVQKGIKGFIYGDRGVWRPGDTMYFGFMLNDRTQTLPPNMPVIMELYNPMGQLVQRKTQTSGQLGVYAFEMPTDPDAPTGAWNVNVKVGGVTFSKRVRVETVKPNRLKIEIGFDREPLVVGEPLSGTLHTEWLTGAVARNLEYTVDGTFSSVRTAFPGFDGFVFDDPSKAFESQESRVASGTTDAEGNAGISNSIDIGSTAPGMLAANLVTRVYEESGDFSLDGMRVNYSPYKRYAGICSPQKGDDQLNTGQEHRFEAVAVDYTGKPIAGEKLTVTIYKVDWYWWWSSSNGRLANYISDSSNRPIRRETLTTGADGRAAFTLGFPDNEWGTYFIRVEDGDGMHSSGLMAYFDWPNSYRRDQEGSDAAYRLTFSTDKDAYAPGETMTVTLPSSEGSRAIVSIENGSRVLAVSEHECRAGETSIHVAVTEEMQPNVYVNVTLLQPHGITRNDLPIRLYGVVPVTVTSPRSHLKPAIGMADEIRPEQTYDFTVSEADGREMAYTVAVVDEGLLDLTRFATPDPWRVFNAREALGVSTWDLYNYVVGAYGGRIEQLFSIGGGEDAGAAGPKAIVNRFKPVVQFDGPFVLKKGEKRKHTYTMPNYNGRVRVMVVAGDGRAYGNAEKSVLVRKPVMLLGTLPRVIGVGEEMEVPATVFATQDGIGNVDVTISCSDNMEVVGPSKQSLRFDRTGDATAGFRIRVKSQPGAGKVTLTARGKGETATYETDIEIRTVRRPQVKVLPVTLGPGQTWRQDVAMHGADGTNTLSLEVSDVPPVNLTQRLEYLIGYPHGCIEQITSKAFPQLYVGRFANLTPMQAKTAEEAVKETIRRYKSYQIPGGAFAYWPGNTSSNAWGSVYATHFLLEAEARGYLVPDDMKRSALGNLSLLARSWKPESGYYSDSERMIQAYRLYVLALGKRAEVGAMNRLKEDAKLPPAARWMLAAAYAQIGRTDVARTIIGATSAITDSYDYEYDLTYGSPLRDRSVQLIALTLMDSAAEAGELSRTISEELSSDEWLSTQSTAYALMAMSAYIDKYKVAEQMSFGYAFGGRSQSVDTDKNVWNAVLMENGPAKATPLEIDNPGQATIFARVVTEGTPEQGNEAAYANRVALSVSYRNGRGQAIDPAQLDQGTDIAAVVTVRNPTPRIMRNLVLTQIFPAGWEILNTRYMNDGEAEEGGAAGISYQDIRDDRVYTYVDYMPSGGEVTVTLNLAATYKGKFYLPPVWVEAMYDNLTRANTEGRTVEVK